jgi:hypothetical protein
VDVCQCVGVCVCVCIRVCACVCGGMRRFHSFHLAHAHTPAALIVEEACVGAADTDGRGGGVARDTHQIANLRRQQIGVSSISRKLLRLYVCKRTRETESALARACVCVCERERESMHLGVEVS